jgi:hypothetical protein
MAWKTNGECRKEKIVYRAKLFTGVGDPAINSPAYSRSKDGRRRFALWPRL